jgi:hypothetical protein
MVHGTEVRSQKKTIFGLKLDLETQNLKKKKLQNQTKQNPKNIQKPKQSNPKKIHKSKKIQKSLIS